MKQGASLNNKFGGETFTYILCGNRDIHFCLKILKLGGDPREENIDGTSLFSPSPKGRGMFMQICWAAHMEEIASAFERQFGRLDLAISPTKQIGGGSGSY